MKRINTTFSVYFICLLIGFLSCQSDTAKVLIGLTSEGESILCVDEFGQFDTLIIFPFATKIRQQKITPDSISLIVETSQFFEYLLINKPYGNWQVDTAKSGPIFSPARSEHAASDSKHRFSFADPNLIQYITGNNRSLDIPLRLIERRRYPSWVRTKESQVPPLPEFPLFILEQELEIDSLFRNRQKRIQLFKSQLEHVCLMDSIILGVQFIIEPNGQLLNFDVVKDLSLNEELGENVIRCIKQIVKEGEFDFGVMKIISSARNAGEARNSTSTILLKRR